MFHAMAPKAATLACAALLISTAAIADHDDLEPGRSDGQLRRHHSEFIAWDAGSRKWLSPADFWLAYAERSGGLTWGRGDKYPPYSAVSELDTFLVETSKGPCLMEFWHSRWRRANDVRRWDEQFNEILGCPYVFD